MSQEGQRANPKVSRFGPLHFWPMGGAACQVREADASNASRLIAQLRHPQITPAPDQLRVGNGYNPSTSPLLFVKVKNPCCKHM